MISSSEDTIVNADILEAHANDDKALLVRQYTRVAEEAERNSDIDVCCYYLTLAYVYALDAGLDAHTDLAVKLRSYGRL